MPLGVIIQLQSVMSVQVNPFFVSDLMWRLATIT